MLYSLILFSVIWAPRAVFRKYKLNYERGWEFPSFMVIDIFVLVFYLCVGNWLVSLVKPDHTIRAGYGAIVTLFIAVNFVILASWILGLRFMKYNQILETKQRLLYQLVLYPLSVYGVTGGITGGVGTVVSLLSFASGWSSRETILANLVNLIFSIIVIRISNVIYYNHLYLYKDEIEKSLL